jgi:hypothetical protein
MIEHNGEGKVPLVPECDLTVIQFLTCRGNDQMRESECRQTIYRHGKVVCAAACSKITFASPSKVPGDTAPSNTTPLFDGSGASVPSFLLINAV